MPQTKSNENKIGLAFPMKFIKGEKENTSGEKFMLLKACTFEEHIKQSIRALLLTGRRERVMRRDFGSRAGSYLYENIGATTTSLIQHEIKTTIERYEPRVELIGVKVNSSSRLPGVLSVEINYRILSADTTDQLTIELGNR